MPPVSAVAAGNRLEFAVALALVWRKDNSSPVLAKFVAEVRLLPFSKLQRISAPKLGLQPPGNRCCNCIATGRRLWNRTRRRSR